MFSFGKGRKIFISYIEKSAKKNTSHNGFL